MSGDQQVSGTTRGEDVLDLWENFDLPTKILSITLLVSYVLTLLISAVWGDYLSPEFNAILVFWPFMVVIWLGMIWLFMTGVVVLWAILQNIFFTPTDKRDIKFAIKLKKFVTLAPIVIGTIFSVIKVFIKDIFAE
jgi:hypothetical protein